MDALAMPGSADLGLVFENQSEMVFGFLLLRCGNRSVAEDLMTETFLAAGKKFDSGQGVEVTPSWLRTVARRRLIDHWRKLSTRRRGIERLARETRPPTDNDDDPDGRIEAALASLPDRQRAVLVLRYLDDFSTSEVAEAIGISYKATESLLARARAAFRHSYEGALDG